MNCTASRIPYRNANIVSRLITDYLDNEEKLREFHLYRPDLDGIKKSIEARAAFPTDRSILVNELNNQYNGVNTSDKVRANIAALSSQRTFTVTTAHQNNIFTGPLYFIYKILHAIRLADELNHKFPGDHFVPVYYMGSEDADLAELNHIFIEGMKLEWTTKQQGAVGRMTIDRALIDLINTLEGRLAVLPFGNEILDILRECYKEGTLLQDATFLFVNRLFMEFGLIVLLPDNAALKQTMNVVFKDDLLNETAASVVTTSAANLHDAGYKVQAHPREINLFYLKNGLRERIERTDGKWQVLNTDIVFTKEELEQELATYPERFSPNVILRGLYQETILPNVAFIGGGGETAYWLQLKDLFRQYGVPFPVLILRNSFLLVATQEQQKIQKLALAPADILRKPDDLLNDIVSRDSKLTLGLNGSLTAAQNLYDSIASQAADIDTTLEKHVEALRTKAIYRLKELEKKMLRAEKRKFSDQRRQISSIREKLFPGEKFQERTESFLPYYATFGPGFIQMLYKESLALEQEFVVLEIS